MQEENRRAINKGDKAPYIGQEILCALCHASVNSLADNVPDELLVLLLKNKLWPEEHIIAYIKKKRGIIKRSKAFALVSEHLSSESKIKLGLELLASAREKSSLGKRAKVLATTAPHLPESMQLPVSEEALAATLLIQDESKRAEILSEIAPSLPNDLGINILEEVFVMAQKMPSPFRRAKVLAQIVTQIDDEPIKKVVFDHMLIAAKELRDGKAHDELLEVIAPDLQQNWIEGILKKRTGLEFASILPSVITYLSPKMRDIVLAKILTIINDIPTEETLEEVLVAIAPYLPQEAVIFARGLQGVEKKARTLSAAVPFLPTNTQFIVLAEALETTQKINDEWRRAKALVAVIPYLPQEERISVAQEALVVVQKINIDEWKQVSVLKTIAQYLPHEVLTCVQKLKDEAGQMKILLLLASSLPQKVVDVAFKLNDTWRRTEVLTAVASHLSPSIRDTLLEEALESIPDIEHPQGQESTIRNVATHLPQKALLTAQQIKDDWKRARLLIAILPFMPKDKKANLLEEALQIAWEIKFPGRRARLLVDIASHMPSGEHYLVFKEVLASTSKINYEKSLASTLVALAPYLPQEVLSIAQAMESQTDQTRVLRVLAPYLPQQVLAIAREFRAEEKRGQILAAVAPHLPNEVLIATQELSAKWKRARPLTSVVMHLPKDTYITVFEKTIEAIREVHNKDIRVKLFTDVSRGIQKLPPSHLYKIWQETLPFLSQRIRSEFFADIEGLMLIIHHLGDTKGVYDTRQAIKSVSTWWP